MQTRATRKFLAGRQPGSSTDRQRRQSTRHGGGIALLLAFLLTRKLTGAGIWRTIIFLPSAVPMLGSTIIWGIALRPDGPVNGVIEALGGSPRRFLTSPSEVLWSLILIASWIGLGYWMMFLIAGLNDIPASAGALRQFVSLLRGSPDRWRAGADQWRTAGGLEPVDVRREHNQFKLSDPYTAAAELVILLVLMLGVVAVQFRLLRGAE